MDKKKLENLLKKEEGPKLDFKQSLDINTDTGKKELVKDVCAIANSQGGRGHIIIGVEDKTKKIIGINTEEIVEEQIQQVVSSRCDPPIPISVEKVKYNGKDLAVIAIYYGEQKPYQVRDNGALIRGKNIQSLNYVKRNMWIYEKLITLDEKKRFNHGGTGFTRIKRAFKKYGKVVFINSSYGNTFKIIYPGTKNLKNNIQS